MGRSSGGTLFIDLKTNTSGLKSDMNQLGAIAKKLGGVLAGAFSVAAITKFGKDCIELASDLNEVQNVVDVTFPNMTAQADKFAKSAAESFGLSETMAKRYLGTFGSMAEAFGFSEKEAYAMSEALTGLAGDVASFYNISQDEAYTKLKSVFSGETETLKELGIVMTQSALDQYALANGFGKTTQQMTEQEKVSLRLAFVTQQLTNASGDFSRTATGWANQVRILQLNFQTLKATIGQSLIRAFSPVIKLINTILLGLTTLAEKFNATFGKLTGKKMGGGATKQISADLGSASDSASGLGSAADTAANNVGKVAKGSSKAAKAAKQLQRTLAGFDKINKLQRNSSGSSGGSNSPSGGGVGGSVGGGGAVTSGAAAAAKKTEKLLSGIKIPPKLQKALTHLRKSFKKFIDVVKPAGQWIVDNILKPLGKWAMNELAPALVEVLASAFDFLAAACKALAPYWQWLWDHLFKKLAKFAGKAVIKFLELLAGLLQKLAVFAEKHPKLFDALVTGLLGFMATKKTIRVIDKVGRSVEAFKLAWGGAGTIKEAMEATGGKIGIFGKRLIGMKQSFEKIKGLKIGSRIAGSFKKIKGLKIGTRIAGAFGKIRKLKIGSRVAKLLKGLGRSLKAFSRVIMSNPVLLVIIAAIAAAIAIGILLYKNWDKIKKKLEPLIKALKKFAAWVKKVTDAIKNKLQPIIDKAKKVLQKFKEAWDAIKSKTIEMWTSVKEKVQGALETIKEKWDAFQDSEVAKLLGLNFKERFENIKQGWDAIKDGDVSKGLGLIFDAAFPGMRETWDAIQNKTAEVIASVKEKVQGAFAKAAEAWNNLKEGTKNITTNAKENIKKSLSAVWSSGKKVAAAFQKLGNGKAKKTLKAAWEKGKNAAAKLFNKLSTTTVTKTLKTAGTTALQKAKNLWDSFKKSTATLTLTFKDTFTAAIKKAWNGLVKSINNAISIINKIPGVNIKKIPTLASGGYVAKNTPQLAVIGDNRHQGEIVAPEGKMLAMAKQAADMSGGGHDAEIVSLLSQILTTLATLDRDVYMDGESVKKRIVSLINARTKATGKCEIIV